MAAQIVDAVVIVYPISRCQLVELAEAVLGDHQRQTVAGREPAQGDAHPGRVDGPVPVAGLKVRIGGRLVEAGNAAGRRSALLASGVDALQGLAAERIVGEGQGVVVVDPDVVGRPFPQQLEIAGQDIRRLAGFPQIGKRRLRIAAKAVGIQPPEVGELLGVFKRQHVFGIARRRIGGRISKAWADEATRHVLAERLDDPGVGQKRDVVGSKEALAVLHCGRVRAELIGVGQVVVLLVERYPVLHLAGITLIQSHAVALEILDDASVFPTAVLILQRLGQIPVIEGEHRLYLVRQQGVDEFLVEGQPRLVHLAAAGGIDTRPAHREAVGLEPHFRHQRHVLLHAVIVIHRHVAVAALKGLARQLGEQIPHRGALAIGVPGPFHLVGGGGGAPQKIGGEVVELVVMHLGLLLLRRWHLPPLSRRLAAPNGIGISIEQL